MMPIGHEVTTAKVSVSNKAFAVHSAWTVANVEEDRACRTKLAAQLDAQRVLDNYHAERFGWHRVTVYGDLKEPLAEFGRALGLKVIEEA